MSWKKTLAATALTASISAGILSAASAASPVNVMSSTYIVNGMDAVVHTISQNGKTLASVRDLGEALGADIAFSGQSVMVSLNGHMVKLATNSDQISVDDVQQQLGATVQSVNNYNYIDLDGYIQGLGVNVTKDASGNTWIDNGLLGKVDNVQWTGEGRLIASAQTDAGAAKYVVDVKSGQYSPLLSNPDASDLVLSPDSKQAAYSDSQGAVYVLDLATKTSKPITTDNNIKPELVWSADGSALYFLNTEKANAIKKLNIADGAISTVLDDKVENKANLNVSADGKTFLYTVTKTGNVTSDPSNIDADNVSIDFTGTDPQVFRYDTTSSDGKAVQLTISNDNKVLAGASSDGSIAYYVSVSADANAKAVLTSVAKDKTVKTVFGDKDVLQAKMSGGKLYLLTAGDAGQNLIYEVDPATGSAKQLYAVSDSITGIVPSGSSIAIILDGIVYAQLNAKWRPVSR